jgi:hypothetical protein
MAGGDPMKRTAENLLLTACRAALIALTGGMAFFSMAVLVDPHGLRRTALALLTRLAA